ncbi:MAG: hypothetical protein R3B90_08120 [Planctomycetaceae bacterium]
MARIPATIDSRGIGVPRIALLVTLQCLLMVRCVSAESGASNAYQDSFETATPSWRVSAVSGEGLQLRSHERASLSAHSGSGRSAFRSTP